MPELPDQLGLVKGALGYGPSYLDEFPDRVGRVTREEVNAAIRAHLDPTKLSIIVAGDLEKFPE